MNDASVADRLNDLGADPQASRAHLEWLSGPKALLKEFFMMQQLPEHLKIIYRERLENVDEFIYLRRWGSGLDGVVIYTSEHQGCHCFACVDEMDLGMAGPRAHWPIIDEMMPCDSFDKLLTLLMEKGILEMESQNRTRSPSTRYFDIIGAKTKNGSENWYHVVGSIGTRPEHREVIQAILGGEQGQIFRGYFQ